MQIMLSPAKIMDFVRQWLAVVTSAPAFAAQTAEVMAALQQLDRADIAHLMQINPKLTATTYHHTQHFWDPDTPLRPALYTYNGEAYHGLDAATLQAAEVQYLQEHLCILSAVYGALRPLDPIRPHRLDMEHKLEVGAYPNLYAYWRPHIAGLLAAALHTDDLTLVNLTSKEYLRSVDQSLLPKGTRVVTPLFLQDTPKGYRQTVVYAKRARGMMVRYMAQQRPTTIDDLKMFDMEGYYYHPTLSDERNPQAITLVFVR